MIKILWAICLFALFCNVLSAPAATMYVWTNSPDPGVPYNAWSNAARTIQNAVDHASSDDDVIIVTNGVYQTAETSLPGSDVLNRLVITNFSLTLISVDGPADTIIKGDTNEYNLTRCLYVSNCAPVVSGFTLTGGRTVPFDMFAHPLEDMMGAGAFMAYGPGLLTNCIITGNIGGYYGGGVAYGRLRNCVVENNIAESYHGGGSVASILTDCIVISNTAAQDGGGLYGCAATNCLISDNIAIGNGGGTRQSSLDDCEVWGNQGDYGGGCSMGTLTNCLIYSNTAYRGGGINASTALVCTIIYNQASYEGGGSYRGRLYDCLISNNFAAISGGGDCQSHLYNCVLTDNQAGRYGGGFGGFPGLLYYYAIDCVIKNNTAGNSGGGVYGSLASNCIIRGNTVQTNHGGGAHSARLYNCVVASNTANGFGGGMNLGSAESCTIADNTASNGGGTYLTTLTNSIVYYNTAVSNPNYAHTSAYYTCSFPLPAGTGNITNDPGFVNRAGGNYHLRLGSSCIDTGVSTSIDRDLEDNFRPLDGNYDAIATYDMGAYEYNPANADSDEDQMPDGWEIFYNLDPTNAADAVQNLDGDPANNVSEYLADTIPTNNLSWFSIECSVYSETCHVFFASSTGRVYTLEGTEDIVIGSWENVADQINVWGNGGELDLIEVNASSGGYYKVRAALP